MKDDVQKPASSLSRSKILGEFQALRPELKKYLLNRLGHEPDAEDLLQELTMRLLSMDLSRLNLITESRAYFYRSLNNLCVDLHRRHSTRTDYVKESESQLKTSPSTEKAVQDRQTLDRLFSMINELPPKCRQVFMLYRIKNLSQKEIAKELGISINMVEKHVIKAHTQLRELMAKEKLL